MLNAVVLSVWVLDLCQGFKGLSQPETTMLTHLNIFHCSAIGLIDFSQFTTFMVYKYSWGARKLTGDNLKLVLAECFNFKLGCFGDEYLLIYMDARPHL